eukprot:sb/3475610/
MSSSFDRCVPIPSSIALNNYISAAVKIRFVFSIYLPPCLRAGPVSLVSLNCVLRGPVGNCVCSGHREIESAAAPFRVNVYVCLLTFSLYLSRSLSFSLYLSPCYAPCFSNPESQKKHLSAPPPTT